MGLARAKPPASPQGGSMGRRGYRVGISYKNSPSLENSGYAPVYHTGSVLERKETK